MALASPPQQTEVDMAKRRYSSDMAAYTFEQFRAARRQYMIAQQHEDEEARREGDGDSSPTDARRDDHEDDSEDDQPTMRRYRGIKSTDFVTRKPATVNGVGH